MKKTRFVPLLTLCCSLPAFATTVLSENFGNIGTLAGSGWVLTNNSSPVGTTGWFQGNSSIFTAQAGAADSYIAANFLNADLGGDISNWLISPVITLVNGDTISFYTQSQGVFEDRLEVRLSAGGSDTGGTAGSVGDFGTLLTTINPSLNGNYPNAWTLVSIGISGIPVPSLSRIAFRYNVPDTNANGDYIGIDTFLADTATPEPATLLLSGLGLAVLPAVRRRVARR